MSMNARFKDNIRPERSGTITSLEKLVLHISGMRMTEEYEITVEGGAAAVSYYVFRCVENGFERALEKRVELGADEVVEKLNSFGLLSWNGFRGDHPRGVRDGIMFRLEAAVDGGAVIRADGSENFPKHFKELTFWLRGVLN